MPYKDPEIRKNYHRKYLSEHPTSLEKGREYNARYKAKHRDKIRERNRATGVVGRRRKRYGITEEQFVDVLREQGGLCALCRKAPPVDIDHDHSTKAFRGLLCRACNLGLGMFGDDVAELEKAIAYLKRPAMGTAATVRKPGKAAIRAREDHHGAKMTFDKVRAMRSEYAAGGVSHSDLGKKYGLHKNTVGRIIRHADWPDPSIPPLH